MTYRDQFDGFEEAQQYTPQVYEGDLEGDVEGNEGDENYIDVDTLEEAEVPKAPKLKRRTFGKRAAELFGGIGGLGLALYLAGRLGGAKVEQVVDAKADKAFTDLTKPAEATAESVLSEGVAALEEAKVNTTKFLSIVQALQKIGTKNIQKYLNDLSGIYIIGTEAQKLAQFVGTVNDLLDTGEGQILATLNTIESGIQTLKQQIATAEQQAPDKIDAVVREAVREVDPLAP